MRKREAPSQKLRSIYRLDLPGKRMDGWHVNITRNRRVFQKYFSNLAHGGEQGALKAAIRYRDRIERKHAPLTRAAYAAIVRKNNTSGVPGVSRSPASARGTRRGHWGAAWVPESGGRTKSAKFSVARHGERRAFELAVAARARGLEAVSGHWQSVGPAKQRKKIHPSGAPRADARIAQVHVGDKRLSVTLRDARLVSVPLWLVPKLARASAAARRALRIAPDERAIEWPALGLRYALQDLLAAKL